MAEFLEICRANVKFERLPQFVVLGEFPLEGTLVLTTIETIQKI